MPTVQQNLHLADTQTPLVQGISPLLELGAYEELWSQPGTTFKRMADRFRERPDALPSDFVDHEVAIQTGRKVMEHFHQHGANPFGVRIHRAGEYPQKLRDARHPLELLYYRGWWDLTESPCVAVVGTRNPSDEGRRRTRKLVRHLVKDNWTIVSGLAAGVDTEAHKTALQCGGRTVAVIGTPLSETYPKQNAELQEKIASDFLLVSQIPLLRYLSQDYRSNRQFFPERNVTMSALTEATIIVEASDTSGTLIQARAAFHQGRKLFILESCFHRGLKWPERFVKQGAIRVQDYAQIREALGRDQSN